MVSAKKQKSKVVSPKKHKSQVVPTVLKKSENIIKVTSSINSTEKNQKI